MASKTINVLLSLADRFTKPMKKIEDATTKAKRQMGAANKEINNFGNSVKSKVYSAVGVFGQLAAQAAGLVSILSINGLVAYSNQCMKLAEDQLKAETQLEAILKNVKSIQEGGAGAVKNAKTQLMDYASQLQGLGVVGDEVTLSGMQQLATFQLNAEQIKTLSSGMLDLLVQQKGLNGTQQDAVGIANMIGKAMTGQATALSRVGITMSEEEKQAIKFGDANQRAAVIARVLKNNVGGVNEAMAKTDMGRSQQVMNSYGDMMEEIGKKILPLKAKFLSMLGPIIPQLQGKLLPLLDKIDQKIGEWTPMLDEFAPKIPGIIDDIFAALDTVFNIAGPIFGFFFDNGDILLGLLGDIAGGFASWQIATKAIAVIQTLGTVMEGVSAAGGIMNFVLAANPITLVVFAVTALIAVFIILYRRCETFRNAVNRLWQGMKDAGNGMANSWNRLKKFVSEFWEELSNVTIISNLVNAVLAAISGRFKAVVNFVNQYIGGIPAVWINTLSAILDAVSLYFSGIINFIVGTFTLDWDRAWKGIQQIFAGVFNGLVALAKAPLNTIISMVNTIISGINSIDFKVPDWVPGIGGTNFAPRVTPIGNFATGTDYFTGGPAEVNEGGRGEIINLPSGSQIIPHDKSIQQAAETGLNRKEKGISNFVPSAVGKVTLGNAKDVMDVIGSLADSIGNIARRQPPTMQSKFNNIAMKWNGEKPKVNGLDINDFFKKPLENLMEVVDGFHSKIYTTDNRQSRDSEIRKPRFGVGAEIQQQGRGFQKAEKVTVTPDDKGSKPQVQIDNIIIQGNVIGNEEFINQCGEGIANRVQMALANM